MSTSPIVSWWINTNLTTDNDLFIFLQLFMSSR